MTVCCCYPTEHGSGLFSWSWGKGDGGGAEREVARMHARISELETELEKSRGEVRKARTSFSSSAHTEDIPETFDGLSAELVSVRKRLALEEQHHAATLELLAQARDPVYVQGRVDDSEAGRRLVAESETKMQFFALARERDALAKEDVALYERNVRTLRDRVDALQAELDADSGRKSLTDALQAAQRKLLETAISRDALQATDLDGMEESVQARVMKLLEEALRLHVNVPDTLAELESRSTHQTHSVVSISAEEQARHTQELEQIRREAKSARMESSEAQVAHESALREIRELQARIQDQDELLARANEDVERLEDDVAHWESVAANLRAQLAQTQEAINQSQITMHQEVTTLDSSLLEAEEELLEKLRKAQSRIDLALYGESSRQYDQHAFHFDDDYEDSGAESGYGGFSDDDDVFYDA